MSGKERLILFTLFLVVMVLLPIAVKATTGDDVVKVRHSKADVSGPRPNITLKTYFTISRH